jgi:signal transduction histidine kinase
MISKWLPKSLTLRAIVLSALWSALALIIVSSFITELYRNAAERNLMSLLSAHVQNLATSTSLDQDGNITGAPELGEVKFLKRNSGWYWSVEPETSLVRGEIKSFSLGSGSIPSGDLAKVPFDKDFRRSFTGVGPTGEVLKILELKQSFNEKGQLARFRVTGNLTDMQKDVSEFASKLYSYLVIFCFSIILANALGVIYGLLPLRAVGQSLKQIREGKSARLEGEFPPEIAPLANEMNALIDNNRRIVERSRTQVGNLAHALKTPLAVMSNEGQALGGAKGAVIAEQTAAMQDQIQRYLQRARIGAQRESVVYRAPISPIIAPTMRTMQKLNPEKQFHADLPKQELVFAGEAEDFQEIIGNVLENAAKWGKKRIELKASKVRSPSGAPMLSVEIGDDGKGLTEKQIAGGIKRGRRLDETKPGTGLGLSIVSDTVREYGGAVTLGKSALGGLSVTFTLPLVE